MKRFIKKNNLKVFKVISDNNLGSIFRIFLSSLILIFFFYSLPIIINFTNSKILLTNSGNLGFFLAAYTSLAGKDFIQIDKDLEKKVIKRIAKEFSY